MREAEFMPSEVPMMIPPAAATWAAVGIPVNRVADRTLFRTCWT
jgi:hypothetical protein